MLPTILREGIVLHKLQKLLDEICDYKKFVLNGTLLFLLQDIFASRLIGETYTHSKLLGQ